MPDQPITGPRGLDPAKVDAHAQGFATLMRQVRTRHGRGTSLTEAAGAIMAAAAMLADLCGPECVRDTMTWHAERTALPFGLEADAPFPLTNDGIPLPEPRTIGTASHHVVRNLKAIARKQGDTAALEATCGALRAGIAILREDADARVLAFLLEHYARTAAQAAALEAEGMAAVSLEIEQ